MSANVGDKPQQTRLYLRRPASEGVSLAGHRRPVLQLHRRPGSAGRVRGHVIFGKEKCSSTQPKSNSSMGVKELTQ